MFSEEDSKPVEVIKMILTHWSQYLTDCRETDDTITAFFRGKPITKCPLCEGTYDLDELPSGHEIPPELIEALKNTAKWKDLMAEAEKGCEELMASEYLPDFTDFLMTTWYSVLSL